MELVRTVLAVLAALMIAIALLLMTSDDLMLAGLSFIGASVVIFLRETRFADE
jgi:hypothetical protein